MIHTRYSIWSIDIKRYIRMKSFVECVEFMAWLLWVRPLLYCVTDAMTMTIWSLRQWFDFRFTLLCMHACFYFFLWHHYLRDNDNMVAKSMIWFQVYIAMHACFFSFFLWHHYLRYCCHCCGLVLVLLLWWLRYCCYCCGLVLVLLLWWHFDSKAEITKRKWKKEIFHD